MSALLAGCASFGAKTVPLDRFEYSNALSESWMRQNLLNIVKVRYLSPPIFVDVSSVVSGYSLQSTVSAGAELLSQGANTFSVGGASTYTDRPTITYVPLTGNKFIKGLMTPLAPDSVFFTVQAGWPADTILTTCLLSVNGIRNTSVSIAGGVGPDPKFGRVVELMRSMQLEGGIAFRIKQDPTNKQQTSILAITSPEATPKALAGRKELRELLRLNQEATELNLVYGSVAANDKEIAVQTRSLLQIMAIMASEVDAPPEHIAQGIVIPDPQHTNLRLLEIHSSKDQPKGAFVAVPYHDYWFWIDDRDMKSKRMFSLMMLLFTLADTGEPANLPLITIPAQ